MKPKIVFISNIAAPYQVKFCYHLQEYFNAEFWFHEHINETRPEWWKIELGSKCKIFNNIHFRKGDNYLSLDVLKELERFDPDVLILGRFTLPTNYLAYRWAMKNTKKVIVFNETMRKNGLLRKKCWKTVLLGWIYRNIDAVFTSSEGATKQLKSIFSQFSDRIYTTQYPSDLDVYFDHPYRTKKDGYTYLFPNRLTEMYNPLLAIEIFYDVWRRYPKSILKMNAMGDQANKCKASIENLGIDNNVEFLTDISSWDDMHLIYRDSDILLFPAEFSNGNFSIVEAMASGMGIVISNKIVWNSEMISNGENGYACEVDKGAFISAIQSYIDNPILFRDHAIRNRKIVFPLSGKATAKMYDKLITKKVLVHE